MRKSIEDGKVGLRMKEKITANLGLKIIACITAFVLWLVIINVDDPVKVAEFDNVEVTLINTDVITKNNKICEVLDNSNFITVKVYASRSVLDSIDASNIRAVADLSELADTIQVADTSNGNAYLDNVKIKLSTNKYNNDLNSISASADYVKVSIEDLKKVQKSIFVDLKGEPAEGYMVGKVSTASNLVRISGPASDVNLIDTVKVSADVTGFTDTISWDADIRLYDEKGNEISANNLTKSLDKVRTTVELLETKEVPIVALTTGTPAENYGLNGRVEIEPSTVVIAGESDVIDGISKLTIPASLLDVTGLTDDFYATVNIKNFLPNSVVLADSTYNGQVAVTVGIEAETTTTISVPQNKLTVENLPEGYSYKIISPEGPMVLAIQGMREDLELLDREKISAVLDFSTVFAEGAKISLDQEYKTELKFDLGEGVKLQSPYEITFKMVEASEEENE